MNVKKIVKKFPYPIQQGIKYIYGTIPARFRYNKVFWDTYNFLQESQWWSREKLEEYQMRQLSKLLNHAYENVPYYRRVFDEKGLKPKDIQDFDDLRKLPCLTKDTFRLHFNEIVSENINRNKFPTSHTSGTTGKPLQFYENLNTCQKEFAFIYHHWSRVGVKPGSPMIQLRGAIIEDNKSIEYNPINKVLRLSPRIDSEQTVRYYLKKMQHFGAEFLHGYPSAIAIFASMIKRYGLSVSFKLNAVLFASETVYPWEKEITREVFNCRVFSHYGMTEKVVLAAECESSHHYHCLPQYGITEFDADTNEIIGTSFLNYINPFIRYKTTDIAFKPVMLGCDKCGRAYFPVFTGVEGRLEDFIITPKGVIISPAIITHPFKDFKTIKATQIFQGSLDHILLKIVPRDDFNPELSGSELQDLCEGLQRILGPDMKIETKIVESIPLTKSGKFKWIISDVSKNFFEKGIS